MEERPERSRTDERGKERGDAGEHGRRLRRDERPPGQDEIGCRDRDQEPDRAAKENEHGKSGRGGRSDPNRVTGRHGSPGVRDGGRKSPAHPEPVPAKNVETEEDDTGEGRQEADDAEAADEAAAEVRPVSQQLLETEAGQNHGRKDREQDELLRVAKTLQTRDHAPGEMPERKMRTDRE